MKWLKDKKDKRVSRRLSDYPACDHLNTALYFLLENPEENSKAIQEICYAISKSGGYFYTCNMEKLTLGGFTFYRSIVR